MASEERGLETVSTSRRDKDWKKEQTSIWAPNLKDATAHHDLGFISSFYQECLQLMSQLWRIEIGESVISKRRIQASKTRLVLWGSGWEEGRLDFCLNSSFELQKNVTALFSGLAKALLCISYHQPEADIPAVRTHARPVSLLREQAKQLQAGEDDQDSNASDSETLSSDEETSTAEASASKVARAGRDIDFYTESLMDLLPSMEQAYKHVCTTQSPPDKHDQMISFQVTEAARPYVLQVHDKFRNAPIALVERLGEANWQRFVRTRRQMASNPQERESTDFRTLARQQSTFVPASEFHDSALGSSLAQDSSYAFTVASYNSFASSLANGKDTCHRVPPTPTGVAERLPFDCFLCKRRLTTIRNRSDWRNHVFADLQPYICTFEGCQSMLVTFASKKAWWQHEYRHHRLHNEIKCSICLATFKDETRFSRHLERDHGVPPPHSMTLVPPLFVKEIESKSTKDDKCPLCQRAGWPNEGRYVAHVSRHLEQIALSVLPSEADSDTEQSDDSEHRSDVSDTPLSPPADARLSPSRGCGPPNGALDETVQKERPTASPTSFISIVCSSAMFEALSDLENPMAVLNFPYTCMYASCERRPSGFATSSDLEIHTMSVHGNLFTRCRPHYFAKNYKQGNIEWQGIDHFDPFENQVSSMHPHESMDMRRIKRSNASFLAKLVAKHSQMSSSADQVDPSPSPPSQPFSAPVINIQHIRGGRDASVPQGVILPEPSNAGPSLNDTTTALPSVGGIDLARSKESREAFKAWLEGL